MSVQDIQNLYKLINDLREKVAEFIGSSQTRDKHFESHIEKDEKWKNDMESQVTAIAQALLQDQTRDKTKKEIGGFWYAVIVIIVTLLANLLPKWF